MFRYPGGKSRLYKYIEPYLIDKFNGKLIVPFIGAGNVTTRFVSHIQDSGGKLSYLWINDADPTITAVWKATYFYPLKFLNRISSYKPSVKDFYSFKEELSQVKKVVTGDDLVVDIALKKMAIHQMSYSGLGVMAGGPIGGQNQSSKYDVGCRWNPKKIYSQIARATKTLHKINYFRITTWDFAPVLEEAEGLTYLDPPYVEQGNALYSYGFSTEDHWRLSEILYNRPDWVLSYDNCQTVRDFYSWVNLNEIKANYSIKGSRQKTELIITN